jgi:hypothetical protein
LREIEEEKKSQAMTVANQAAAKPPEQRTQADKDAMARGKILEEGLLPGYKTFPGTNTQFKVGGFVAIDAVHDFNKVSSDTDIGSWAFDVITEGNPGHGQQGDTFFTANRTRLNFDMRTPTPSYGQLDELEVFVESDFYPSSNALRIRHAYGKWGPLLVGQTWPLFHPIRAMPKMYDFAGPVASNPSRVTEIRWDQPIGKHFKLGVNMEDPDGQILIPSADGTADADVKNQLPDFTVRGLYEADWGHLQLSGMLRKLAVQGASGEFSNDTASGWNTYLSGKFNTFGDDKLGFGATYGDGMGRWRSALAGQNQDAVLTPSGLKTVPSYGGFVNYQHQWTPKLSTSLMYSYLKADNPAESPDGAIKETNYGLANLIWSPTPVIDIGAEYTYVDRRDEDGAFGNNHRMSLVFVYKFHKDPPKTSAYENVGYLLGGGG